MPDDYQPRRVLLDLGHGATLAVHVTPDRLIDGRLMAALRELGLAALAHQHDRLRGSQESTEPS